MLEHVDCAIDQQTAWWIAQSTWCARLVPAENSGDVSAAGQRGHNPGMAAFIRSAVRRTASRDYPVASQDSMMRRAEGRSRLTGQSLDEAAAVVVEDLERAAAALSTRTAPMVPACGVLVAAAGLLLKAGFSDGVADIFLGFAVLFAVVGLSFLARANFIYAGRRIIGLSPTVGDIAFARDRLVRKHACTYRGGWLAGIGLACLILGILLGVRITLGTG
jgi:hypothetical protein